MGPTPETRETSREPREERPLARDEERRVDDPQERVDDQEEERGERIDLQTLALAALASAAAALITSRLWARGAVISAAMTPVIVALVKEGLRKPSERVTAVGSRVASVSKSSLAVVTPRVGGRPAPTAPGGGDSDRAAGSPKPGTPAMTGEPAKPSGRAFARLRVFRSKRFHLRMALITGLLAFLIAVFALTVPELIVGDSVGSGGGTTLFGGGDASDEGSEPSEDAEGGSSAPSPDGEAPAPASGQQPEAQPEEAPAPEEEPPAEEPPSQPVQPQVAPPSGG